MALDAKSGERIWKSKVEYPARNASDRLLRHHQPRPCALRGQIFRTTLDAHVVALDAKTGKELWRSNAID